MLPPPTAPRRSPTGELKTPSKPISTGQATSGSGGSLEDPFNDAASSMTGFDDADACGTDAVNVWQGRIPLSQVMAGTIDGRTVSGLRKRIKRLLSSKDPNAKSEADDLQVFEKLVKAAEDLRAEDLQSTSWDAAKLLVDKIVKDGDHTFPKATMLKLVSLKLASLDISLDAAEYIRVASPLGDSKFDPQDPTLGSTGLPDKDRLAEFFRIVIRGHICNAVSKGRESAAALGQILITCIAIFESVDYLMSSGMVVKFANDFVDAAKVVRHMAQPAAGASILDIGEELERFCKYVGKSGNTLSHTIAASLSASPFYQSQLEMLQRTLPFAKEQFPSILTA
eukprot:7249807-Pyramimonas_sp.AAC.1